MTFGLDTLPALGKALVGVPSARHTMVAAVPDRNMALGFLLGPQSAECALLNGQAAGDTTGTITFI